MKQIFTLLFLVLIFASCEIIIVEPAYDPREEILGTWDIEEYSETYNLNTIYSIHIDRSYSSNDAIYIRNFYDVDISVLAYVDGNKIVIPLQVVNSWEVSGIGTIRNNNEITFSYTVYDTYYGGLVDYCDAIAW